MAFALIALFYTLPIIWRRWGPRNKALNQQDFALAAFSAQLLQNPQQGQAALQQAIDSQPQDPHPFVLLGMWLSQTDDWRKAKILLSGVLARPQLDLQLRRLAQEFLLETLIRGGEFSAAAAEIEQFAQALTPRDDALQPQTLGRYAELASGAQAYTLCHHLCARLEKIDPEQAQRIEALAYAAEAEQLADSGQNDRALKLVKKAQSRGAKDLVLSCLHGELARRQSDLGAARDAFFHAAVLDPGVILAAFPVLEDSHIEHGEVAEYETLLHKIIEATPHQSVALWALGMHHWRRQHLDEAQRIFQEAANDFADFAPIQRALKTIKEAQEHKDLHKSPPQQRQVVTRCDHCGREGVQAIVRCPHCHHVGAIHFAVDGCGKAKAMISATRNTRR